MGRLEGQGLSLIYAPHSNSGDPVKLTNPEKLILVMLADVCGIVANPRLRHK